MPARRGTPRPPRTARGTRAQERQTITLSHEQVEAVLRALPHRSQRARHPVRAFFRVMWETGLRRATLWPLRAPQDYQKGSDRLVIRDAADKARYGRALPLTAAARASLDEVCPGEGAIFPRADLRHLLRAAARDAGLPELAVRHLSNHDFRHSRTTDLLDQGGSLTGVAYLVGHKQVTTTNATRTLGWRPLVRCSPVSAERFRDPHWDPKSPRQPRNAKTPPRGQGWIRQPVRLTARELLGASNGLRSALRKRGLEPPRVLPH
ncbi:MAG: tyrosine-type recombinase/integrase [Sandaracinaceae bacterium]